MRRLAPDRYNDIGLPWVEKYRPQTLGDVVAQQDITQTLQTFIDKVCPFVFSC
jgi:hypothetical protein